MKIIVGSINFVVVNLNLFKESKIFTPQSKHILFCNSNFVLSPTLFVLKLCNHEYLFIKKYGDACVAKQFCPSREVNRNSVARVY